MDDNQYLVKIPTADAMIGRVLGHYKLIEQVGAGGMGVVYRARDERLERDVALKVLSTGSLGTDQTRSRLRKEALALAQLSHANIGAVYDFDTHDGVDFLVMEFVVGQTLGDRLHTTLSEREVLALGVQVARALEDAHERGIVHRDLKPGNIIQDEQRLASTGEVNREAYDLYLKGIQYADQETDEGQTKSIETLEKAVQLDPQFASAHARLALMYTIYYMGGGLEPKRFYPKAKGAALRALDIDDSVSEAYVALGNEALSYAWNWPDAERHYRRAIQLNPSNASAHERYATYLQSIGRFDDALTERNLARDLDPRSPFRIANTGYPLYYAGQYDEAIRRFRQALEADSRFYWANLWIGQALVQQGKFQEAIAEMERAVTLSERNTRVVATLGNAYALAGRRTEAQALLNELRTRSQQTYVSAFYLALVYAGLGMRDQMLEQLEKAIEERPPILAGLNVEPPFLPFHGDPRFQAIVQRIGIPTSSR